MPKVKEYETRRVHCRVTEKQYNLLEYACSRYGFRSVYEIAGALIQSFAKYLEAPAYTPGETSIPKEIEDIFEELMQAGGSTKAKSFTTDTVYFTDRFRW